MRPTRMEMSGRGRALAAARSLVLSWTWLYTAALPEQFRTARREEIRSDLHDHIEQDREEGVVQAWTAVGLLRRMASGAWDDVCWALPQVTSALAVNLVRGGEAIGQMRTPPWAISYVAVAALVNVCLALSDWNRLWPTWPLVNAVVLAATLLLQKQRQPWTRDILLWGGSFTFALALGIGILAEWGSGPPWPLPYSLILEAVVMVPLVILALLVASRVSGVYGFEGNRWRLVLLCVPVIGVALWGSGAALDGSPENLIEVSAASALLSVVWGFMAASFAWGSRVAAQTLLGGTAGCIRLLAIGARLVR